MKQISAEAKTIKEEALKNAGTITEEELREDYFTPEEFRDSVLSEFNRLADEIELEDGRV